MQTAIISEYSITFLLTLLGISGAILSYFFKNKDKELGSKINSKDLIAKEESLKSWVKECITIAKDAISKDFKIDIEKVVKNNTTQIEKMEERLEKRIDKISEGLEQYKKYNHDRADKAAQVLGTNTRLLEGLDLADRVISKALKLEKAL